MRDIMLSALRASLVAWVLCGIAYPLALTALGQWLMPVQANGSLERSPDGTIIGSRLIGQFWNGQEWFHGRPSATTGADPNDPSKTVPAPYNAASSGASNLGPTSKELAERLCGSQRIGADATGARGLKAAGRHADHVDPDISPANAALQAARVAHARGVPVAEIEALIAQHITARGLGILGEPRVNVLALNLALQRAYPAR